jgi:phenylacetate-CoA ligase
MWPSRLRWSAYFAWHLAGQARFAFRPLPEIEREQRRRLRWMTAYAYRSVPYYRETFDRLGLSPDDFRSADDLSRLPILERGEIQRDPEYFCSTAPRRADLLRISSSGSSGAPRTVFHDPRGIFQNAAQGERERSIWTALIGRRIDYRELVIISPNSTIFKVQQYLREHGLYPRGVSIERRYLSLHAQPDEAVRLVNDFKPDVIHSYGSYLAILFGHLAATGEAFHRPAALTYTSDGLSDSGRRLIAERFGLPVFTTYQAVEAFKIGFECEQHCGVHLNLDLYPLRVVDAAGRTLPAGESGEVIVSNLVNCGSVLLNYRLGDIAALLPGACACGRTTPMLSFPQGRSDDLIELDSGQIVHPQMIRTLFNPEGEIWEFQVVHQDDGSFRVSLLAAPRCDRAATRERVVGKFAELLGPQTRTEVVFVDTIDRTASGKFRPVISRRARAGA